MPELRGQIWERQSGRQLEARVHILASTGQFCAPKDPILKVGGGDPYFYSEGKFSVDVQEEDGRELTFRGELGHVGGGANSAKLHAARDMLANQGKQTTAAVVLEDLSFLNRDLLLEILVLAMGPCEREQIVKACLPGSMGLGVSFLGPMQAPL